jgi:hypothetical protein
MKRGVIILAIVFAAVLLLDGIACIFSESVRIFNIVTFDQFTSGLPNEHNYEQAEHLSRIATEAAQTGTTPSPQSRIGTVFVQPGARGLWATPAVVSIYGFRDPNDQQRVIAAVDKYVQETNSDGVTLRFCDLKKSEGSQDVILRIVKLGQ